MFKSLMFKTLVYPLSIFYLAVNNLIALTIPNYFYLNRVLLDLFLITRLVNLVAIMIIIFIAFFPRTIRDWNSFPSNIISTK